MCSWSGSGDPSNMKRCTCGPTTPWPRRGIRSPVTSAFTTPADHIRALTGKHPIRPTSPSFRRSRRLEPGRRSTYQPKNLFRQTEPPHYARANGEHTVDVLRRLRAEWPEDKLIVVWDGASYHRACVVQEAAEALHIVVVPLPGYSPNFMPVEALWRWLREDVTYHYCHPTAEDLSRRVADFETRLNQDAYTVADRLWVKDRLNPDEEKLRFPG